MCVEKKTRPSSYAPKTDMTMRAKCFVLTMITLLSKSRSFQLRRNPLQISRLSPRSRPTASLSDDHQNELDNNEQQVHQVQWNTSNGTIVFDAFDGETLRTACLRRGVVSPHNGRARLINCRGLGTCGTCAVEIETMDNVEPQQRNPVERARLNFPPHGGENQSPNLRLACQVQVRGDVVVTKRSGFWGQYNDLAESSRAETYFGDLEFVLDRKSPDEPASTKEG